MQNSQYAHCALRNGLTSVWLGVSIGLSSEPHVPLFPLNFWRLFCFDSRNVFDFEVNSENYKLCSEFIPVILQDQP